MKLKPLILIFTTLLIGFFIGFLTSAQLRHKRMNPVRIYSSERRFREDAYRIFEPDEEQMVKLDPIIRKYGKASSELQREYRKNFESIMENYFQEVKPLLTQEQLDRINSMEQRRREAVRRFRPDSLQGRHRPDDSSYGGGYRGRPGGPPPTDRETRDSLLPEQR